MKTREILSKFDWPNVTGNSSQFETVIELVRGELTLKQAIKYTYVRRNKKLLRQIKPNQLPYFLEATRKILNVYVRQQMTFRFNEEKFLAKAKKIIEAPLTA